MIYITGDIHGDLSRFSDKKIKRLKKNDYLIICGDFGFIWDNSLTEQKTLKKLGKKKYNILFVEGCHENYELLYSYPQQDWNGGKVRQISGKLKQLMRGHIFEIDGFKIFAFGGGYGNEHDIRREVKTCWEQELPTEEELAFGIENLNKNERKIDYIVTHEPPANLMDFLGISEDVVQTNQLNTAFNNIAQHCTFKRWFFGKCHKDKVVSYRYHAVFNEVIKIEVPKPEKKKKPKKEK